MTTIENPLALRVGQRIVRYSAEQGFGAGDRLTERKLASEFNVSRSPIRAALRILEERGAVSRDGGGYVLALDPRELEDLSLEAPTAAEDDLYVRILRDRFAGKLPERVSEADLLRQYKTTRGVLTKALMRLNQEGQVSRSPGRGWAFMSTLSSVEAYQASYEFRLAIEPAALSSPNYRVDKGRVQRLLDRHQKLMDEGPEGAGGLEWFSLDAELHEMVVGFAGNEFFTQAIRTHNQLRSAPEIESFYQHERVRDSFEEHFAILQALLNNDRAWAATLLRRHLELARDSVVVFLSPPEH